MKQWKANNFGASELQENGTSNFLYILANSSSAIAIYTMLCVLGKMKRKIGLEAMLEFSQKYMDLIERRNPKIKHAIAKTLTSIDIEEIYKESTI